MDKTFSVGVAATGLRLPERSYSNDEVLREISSAQKAAGMDVKELTSAWIEENIGIASRHYFSDDERLVDMSAEATQQALDRAGWDPMDLDFIIFASISMHSEMDSRIIPSSACCVQEQLRAYNAFAYDSVAACSGFVYGMAQGVSFIEAGMSQRGAVICAEKQRKGLDFTDHRSSVLIGDAATVTLLEKTSSPKVYSMSLHANDDKQLSDIIHLKFQRQDEEGAMHKGYFGLQGPAVFKEGIRTMALLTLEALAHNHLSVDDVDWFIYHQANGAMLRMVQQKVGFAPEKNLMNIDRLANTTGATIPSVLHMHIENGTIQRGDKICCVAFGGGLTSGSVVFEY